MYIVSFSGVDGSGKTTQLKLFKKHLRDNKIKFKTVHIVQNSIGNRILNLFKSKKKQKKSQKTIEDCNLNKEKKACIFAINLRKIALIFDILVFRVYYFFNKNKDLVLIFDRYFYDYLINIYYLENRKTPEPAPITMDMIINPHLAFYFKVDKKDARKRKNEQSIGYIEKKIELFRYLKKIFKFIEIKSKYGEQKEINKQVIKYFNQLKK